METLASKAESVRRPNSSQGRRRAAARELWLDSRACWLRRTASARMIEVAGDRIGTEAGSERRNKPGESVRAKLVFINFYRVASGLPNLSEPSSFQW